MKLLHTLQPEFFAKSPLTWRAVIFITFLIGTALVLSRIFLFPEKINTAHTYHLYPTGFYPTSEAWTGRYSLVFTDTQGIHRYDTRTRTSHTILPDIYIGRTIPSLSPTMLCLTTVNEISSPDEIATIIDMYSMADGTLLRRISSSLTLVPIGCTNPLYLHPPAPLDETNLFRWELENPLPEKLSQIALTQTFVVGELGTIVTLERKSGSVYFVGDSINDKRATDFGLSDTPLAGNFTHERKLALLFENSVRFYNVPAMKEAQTIQTHEYNEHFIAVCPYDETVLALISSSGELWILEGMEN